VFFPILPSFLEWEEDKLSTFLKGSSWIELFLEEEMDLAISGKRTDRLRQ
jgi:hypothetical protein